MLVAGLVCGALAVPGVALADHGAGDTVSIEGTLVVSHSDDFEGNRSRRYYALERAGRRIALDFARRPALRAGTRLRVRGALRGGRLRVASARKLRAAPTRRLAAVSPGPRSVGVVLFNFSNNSTQPYTRLQAEATMFTKPGSVSAYFNEESFGATSLTGDVFEWVTLPVTNANCQIDSWAARATSAAASQGFDPDNYHHVVYAFPAAPSCNWAGLAEMPGSRAWINGAFNLRVIAHELTHNLGAHHAASYSCSEGGIRVQISSVCTANEYGDPFDVMGAAATRHTSSWHKGQIGWLAAPSMQTVTGSGSYAIAPQEYASVGAQALRIPRGTTGFYYYLEFRRPFGTQFDNFAPTDPAVNGVSIRLGFDYPHSELSYLIDATPATTTFSDAPLASGQLFSDPAYGIWVRTTSVSSSGATVDVTFGTGPPALADTTPPGAPGNPSASLLAGPRVLLSWTAASDNAGVTGYRVYRGGVEIGTSTGLSFTDGAPPAGTTISYSVRARDAAGNLGPPATVTVTTPGSSSTQAPVSVAPPVISGTPREGERLTASPGSWSGAAPLSLTYRWLRCDRQNRCVAIAGAAGSSYKVTRADVGRRLRVRVTATNARGSATALSKSSAKVLRAGAARKAARDPWRDGWGPHRLKLVRTRP
jgi:Gametolysin peptidase M11